MSLFQHSVLNKYLKEANQNKIKAAFEKLVTYFQNPVIQQNIRESKEEQFQEGFLRELFVNILGYTINPDPDFNLTTEFKNERGAKKADGAILNEGSAIGVIELKSTKTKDLESIRLQAFDYKANHQKCIYVITSNFEKVRFYINNAVDYEEFDLFKLKYEEFQLLWLCLAKDNLLKGIPLAIKEASILKEENITNQIYVDYSLFKRELYADLIKNNLNLKIFNGKDEKEIKLLLFKKSQKLLDRFLFIFFGEDRGLLPPNSISEILTQWEQLKELDEYKPLYDRYKKYFNYLNKGWKGKKHEIFAYNGGLFAHDKILDSIKINDELLQKHTKVLTAYDFETDVDVNILGHIFENSLNEIEEITAQIEGAKVDLKKSKRKKEGVFYTPKYITKYIVENTVGKLCEEKKTEFEIEESEYLKSRKGRTTKKLKELDEKLVTYRKWLLKLTICDPACGSGAFLNQALDFLINEHHHIDDLKAKLLDVPMIFTEVENNILENNIFGVDINEESVEIAKLSLWLRTAQKGRKLTTLSNNIKCGNSLIDDPEIAGEKAFNWQNEFPEIFKNGGFDVVIGNPPYVFARDNISKELKEYYINNYVSAEYQVNTYLLFIEQTIKIMRDTANYGLIIPNAWLMVGSATGLRNYILQNCSINEIINLAGYSFQGVNVETIIILATKTKQKQENNAIKVLLSDDKEFKFSHYRKQLDFENNEGFEFKVFSDETSVALTKKLKTNSKNLDDLVLIKAGLKAYEKNKGEPKQTVEDVKNRPFDYAYQFDENTHKYLEGKDVGRYYTNWSGQYLLYGKHLAAPRTSNLFDGEKIIIREITGKFPKSIIATYSDKYYLFNMSNISIIEREELDISLKYVVAVLNSQLLAYYFVKNTAKSVRKMFPKIILNDLRKFPFKEISESEQQPFVNKAETILTLNENLQNVSTKLIGLLQSELSIERLTKKIENWHSIEWSDFEKELKRIKIVLTGEQKEDWFERFNRLKTKAQNLKSEINKTDRKIDQMVYELYGLTDEEIKIVEES